MINVNEELHGRKPIFDNVNELQTANEKLFGNKHIKNVNPLESNILKRSLIDSETATKQTIRPESEKIGLERQLQKETQGVNLKGAEKYIEPEIITMLENKKVPNASKVAHAITSTLSKYNSKIYGSLVQAATKRMMIEKKIKTKNPPIVREWRDIDTHMENPGIAAYELTREK